MAGKKPKWKQPTGDAIREASGELIALVEPQLPQRIYREHPWRIFGAAFIMRMTDTVESIMALMAVGHAIDGLVLLRALYEQVVVYCWASIDQGRYPERWRRNGLYWLLKLHNDVASVSKQKVLRPTELAQAKADAVQGPSLIDMAAEVDAHWGGRLIGFRSPQGKASDILTFRGLYAAVYRMGSRAVHVEQASLEPYIDYDVYPRRVDRGPKDDPSIWWPLTVPLYAQALLVCNEQLRWPDPDKVRAINNAMYSQPAT